MVILMAIYAGIFGSILASFFGVIICRVPNNESIVKPASHCECGHVLKWYENIPILSYIFLGGKCSKCKTKIGIESFIYELIGFTIGLVTVLVNGLNYETLIILGIVFIYLLMAGYDYKTKTILDIMWIILVVLEIILFLYRVFVLKNDYLPYLISFGIGSLFFILIKLIGLGILKKDILGTGDIIVFGISCLSFNYFGILLALISSCLPGSVIELIKMKKKGNGGEIPFLPYLLIGCFISLLWASPLYRLIMEMI